MLDLVIKNGKIVTESDLFEGDIGIKNGVISEIAGDISTSADETIDASGKMVIPGLVDGHTHFELPIMGTVTADDFESGTVAAACGGVTTVIDFAMPKKGTSLVATYDQWRKKADNKVAIDYGLHLIIHELDSENFAQIKQVMKKGVQSFKLFTTYRTRGLMLGDYDIFRVLREVSSHGGIVGIHCENNDFIECLVSQFLEQGHTEPKYHAKSRPPESEVEAVRRVISLGDFAQANLYIVHTSTGPAVQSIKEAKKRGSKAYSETCPHYLTFTDLKYESRNAKNYVMSPPLRKKEDLKALWNGIRNGEVHTVASDHCCFTSKQKDLGKNDFSKIPNGVPGTEVILPILYSEGVRRDIITLQDLVRVSSYNPAKQFGLYPKKGAIRIGSDADLVILDPRKKKKLTKDNLHSRLDNSIYEDVSVLGYPVLTLSRGRVAYRDDQFTGKKGTGEFVPGKLSQGSNSSSK